MPCFVYASLRKPDCYLWLARRDDFSVLSESLSSMLGELRFVLEVQLDVQRKLPHEDIRQVREHLTRQGWHLQLPPPDSLTSGNHLPYRQSPEDDPHG